LSFTAANWEDPQTVTVSAADDDDAADDTATINLTAAGGDYGSVEGSLTVDVDDNDEIKLVLSATTLDVTEGRDATFTVALDSVPSASVTVTLTQPSNNDVTVDDTSLIFTTENWSIARAITVFAADDTDVDEDSATIGLKAAGGGYDSAAGTVTVTVADDDIPQLILTPASLTVAEGASKTFTVRLNTRPLSAASIDLASDNEDVTLSPTSLDFTTTNWGDEQTVTVQAVQDPDASNDTAAVSLTDADDGIGAGSLTVTVTDDGDIGLMLSANALAVDENGETSLTVRLHAAPAADITVALESDSDEVTLGAASLTFSGGDDGNWNTPQRVTVRAADDDDNADDTAMISLRGSGITNTSVTVTVTDDDKGATLEQEEEAAAVILAEVAGALLPAASSTIGVRFDAGRGVRTATVAGQQLTLDRSLAGDLAASFAARAGVQDASQGRFAEDRFGAERHSGEWLGGIPLDAIGDCYVEGKLLIASYQASMPGHNLN
ncbi:MAG: hypothetical protein ISN29_11435, partial [Gammaproteobacteria bacterium AqS3]|nr:hypothetical protein [Gammaproteobacteria bacterium AqS3]